MVPKQETNRISSRDKKPLPLFGSQLVDENSKTPYSDATQVRVISSLINNFVSPKSNWF